MRKKQRSMSSAVTVGGHSRFKRAKDLYNHQAKVFAQTFKVQIHEDLWPVDYLDMLLFIDTISKINMRLLNTKRPAVNMTAFPTCLTSA